MAVVMFLAAAAFAVTAGSNDGASLLAAGLRVGPLRPVTMLISMIAAVAAGPVLFGTRVASTLALKLSPLGDTATQNVTVAAVISSIVVVVVLNRRGLPTSSTLAIIGAIAGASLGGGLPVATGVLFGVLGASLLAPILSGALTVIVLRRLNRHARSHRLRTRLRQAQVSAFIAQCLAYSANGGQKMLAVFALALGTAGVHSVRAPIGILLLMAALFGLGVLIGMHRVSGHLGSGIARVHLRQAVAAEFCAAAVTFVSAMEGVPLTSSQAIGGALIGAASSNGIHRVRLGAVARMLGAWLITLPASFVLAAITSATLVNL